MNIHYIICYKSNNKKAPKPIQFSIKLIILLQIDNGPVWHWFLLNILPLENDFQYKFLTKTSLKERLKQIKKLLIFMLLIDRSRQQMTSSTSSQNIYEGDGELTGENNNNLNNRNRSSNQIDTDQQENQN